MDTIDFTNPDMFIHGTPYDLFAQVRRAQPVSWQPTRAQDDGFWLVMKHQDVVAISKNPALFSPCAGTLLHDAPSAEGSQRGPWAMLAGHLNAMAPPKHTALRQILGPELAARALTRLEPKIKAATTELLDRAADKRALNFAEEVALALPVRIVLGELLGIPREDQPQVVRWSGAIAAPEDHTLSPTPDTPLRALEALYAYGLSRVRACRTSPREDLIGHPRPGEDGRWVARYR